MSYYAMSFVVVIMSMWFAGMIVLHFLVGKTTDKDDKWNFVMFWPVHFIILIRALWLKSRR